MNVNELKGRIAGLLSDPDQDSLTNAFLLPFINQAYEAEISTLKGTCSPFETKVITLPNLPIGTTDLTAQQRTAAGPLLGLTNPLRLKWKPAGAPENQYQTIARVEDLPDLLPIQPNGLGCSQASFEWRSNVVFITPFGIAIDLQVKGEFNPPPLLKDDDWILVHPDMGHVLAFGAAALAAVERGNPEWVQSYGALETSALNRVADQLVREQQSTTFRAGRLNGRR
jgi:hypothetical protein